jgi:hypothetical protein
MANRYLIRLERERERAAKAADVAPEIKDPPLQDGDIVRVHGVLAGVYQGSRRDLQTTLTHALVEGHNKTVCGKIPADHLADLCYPAPTCPTCVRKLRGHPIMIGYEPNASGAYYVWVLRQGSDTPLASEGPYGPMSLSSAESNARIGASKGIHDRAVSRGKDPSSGAFRILRRYAARTGQRMA